MEKFLGKFESVPELTEGLDAYFDAMKLPAEAKETMRSKKVITCLFKEGEDSYKEFNDYGDYQEEFVFKPLGVPTVTSIMGIDTTNTFTLNGDHKDGVSQVAGQTTTSSRYFQGDYVVFEASGNGATMKTFLKRIS